MNIKKKIIFTSLICAVIIGAVIYFIIIPSIEDIKNIQNAVYLERLDLEERYQKGQSLRKSQEDFRNNKEKVRLLTSVFIQKGNELEFLNQLEKIAEDNKLVLEKKLSDPGEATYINHGFKSLPLELNIGGDFSDMVNFLRQLETIDIYIDLGQLSLSKIGKLKNSSLASDTLDQYNVSAKFNGLTFWQEEKIETNSQNAQGQ